eukprot:1628405-Amphidinium_carterae.1
MPTNSVNHNSGNVPIVETAMDGHSLAQGTPGLAQSVAGFAPLPSVSSSHVDIPTFVGPAAAFTEDGHSNPNTPETTETFRRAKALSVSFLKANPGTANHDGLGVTTKRKRDSGFFDRSAILGLVRTAGTTGWALGLFEQNAVRSTRPCGSCTLPLLLHGPHIFWFRVMRVGCTNNHRTNKIAFCKE